MTHPQTIAVTGLNATENPGPGVAVIRALRDHPVLGQSRIVGLLYDALEPGAYDDTLVDALFLLPYPSLGRDALLERLEYIRGRLGGLDAIIPTLDAELPSFIALEERLRGLGVGMFLPSMEQFELRSKSRLNALSTLVDIAVPASRALSDASELSDVAAEIPLPFVVKGPYYGATVVRTLPEAVLAFHAQAARWGLPIIVQQFVTGQELDVVAVGDGAGGLVGAVPMKKTYMTDKGKGWAGIAIRDPELMAIAERFMASTRWRGPCELEIIRDGDGSYQLLEINPRFPAWVYLAAGAGMNLPAAVTQLALGEAVAPPMEEYRVGTMFVRIALDQVVHVSEGFEAITTTGELIREEERR